MTESKLYQAIENIANELSTRSAEIEEARHLPPDIAAQLAEAKLFNILRPAELGGLELSPDQMMRLVSKLSETNASVGWCVMIGATSTLLPQATEA